MKFKEIQERAASWFEWPGSDRSSVTTTSACIFAREVADEAVEDMRAQKCAAVDQWTAAEARCIALRRDRDELREAIRETLEENLHLADGDVCTLSRLKSALQPNA